MSLTPSSYSAVRHSPTGQGQTTMVIALPSAAGAPTVIDFRSFVGAWLCWCPEATAADTVQVRCQMAGDAVPTAASMNLPAPAGTYQAVDLDVFRGDEQFLLDVQVERVQVQSPSTKIVPQLPQWTQFAFQWSGAADSYLVMRRVGLR